MAGLQILLVASADAKSSALADLLRSGGHHVVVEPDSAAAVQAVSHDPPDTLVLDRDSLGVGLVALASALTSGGAAGPPAPLEAVEREHIVVALRHTRGNKRRAAQLLGIARSTLIQKVRRYQIQPAELGLAGVAGD